MMLDAAALAHLPQGSEVKATRRRGMIASHVMLIIPLAAVLLARGLLAR